MKNILIVDNDLGFIFWLGAVLIAAGYQRGPLAARRMRSRSLAAIPWFGWIY